MSRDNGTKLRLVDIDSWLYCFGNRRGKTKFTLQLVYQIVTM